MFSLRSKNIIALVLALFVCLGSLGDAAPSNGNSQYRYKQTESVAESKPISTDTSQEEVEEAYTVPLEDTIVVVLDGDVKAPFLWKVERPDGGGVPSYLFGTIHIPDTRVTTLPDHVQEAFDSSDAVYTEIPMGLMDQLAIAPAVFLPYDQKLSEIIGEDLVERIDKLASQYSFTVAGKEMPLSFDIFERQKVWSAAAQVGMLDLLNELMSAKPLDMQLYMNAAGAGKEVGGLETAKSQIEVFDTLTIKEQIQFLEETLDAVEKAQEEGLKPSEMVVDGYLSGDTNKIVGSLTETMDLTEPFGQKMYQRLLIKRDIGMSDKIEELMTANPDKQYFFAVGALHLPRERGIIGLLRKEGYTVTRVIPEGQSSDQEAEEAETLTAP